MKSDHQFFLEIIHNKNHIKLPVYSSDTFEKLVLRLIQMTKSPSSKRIKISQRLRQQLVALSTRITLSDGVQYKIKNLLFSQSHPHGSKEESYKLNQTPFQILQDSLLLNTNQNDKRNKSKSYKYLQENAELKMKYSSQNHEPSQLQNPYYTYHPSPLRYQQRSSSPFFNDQKREYDEYTQNFVLKCEALEKKCNDYISKNIKKQKNSAYTRKQQDNSDNKKPYQTYLNGKTKDSKSQIDKKFSNLYLDAPACKEYKQTPFMSTDTHKTQTKTLQSHEPKRQKRYNYLADS